GQVLPEAVIEQALRSPDFFDGEGKSEVVTVLFSDIRGYTDLAEKLDPQKVSEMLNEYHRAMDPVFEEFGGTVFDYQGDAQMVVFGAPRFLPNHAISALGAAVRMREVLQALRK